MDVNPIATERRRARRRRTGNEKCVFLDGHSGVEWHHVAGDVNDEGLTVPLCIEHHDIATEMQRTQGVDLGHTSERSVLERVGHGLVSIGSFLMMLAVALVGWGRQLLTLANELDTHFPTWRSLPGASPGEA